MYVLHGHVQSRALRPLWMLEELGLDYTFRQAAPRSPEAFAVSPLGKIPVLETPEGILTDSVAMMTMLADAEQRFTYPAGSYDRGRQDALTNTINEMLDAVLWENAKHIFVLPEEHRVPAVFDSLKWQFRQNAGVIADLLAEGPYLMGAEPLIPDFLLAHCCAWGARRDFDVPDPLRAHMNRMRARPAFRRAIARGDT